MKDCKDLSDYHCPVCVEEDSNWVDLVENEEAYAYCMDGCPRGGKYDMARDVGLAWLHCCDYFFFEKDAISLVEITQIRDAKITQRCLYRDVLDVIQAPAERDFVEFLLFKHSIAAENVLKMYGSIIIINKFAQKCQAMHQALSDRGGKFNYQLVIYNKEKNNAINFEGFDNIKKAIEKKLCDKLKSNRNFGSVKIFPRQKIVEEINKNANYNP